MSRASFSHLRRKINSSASDSKWTPNAFICATTTSRTTTPKIDHVRVAPPRFKPLSADPEKAHTSSEVIPMVATAGVWKKKCDTLKAKRNALFATYAKEPQNLHLAREIKAIDDEIADCTQHVEQQRRAEQRAASPAKLVTTSKQ